MPLSQKKINLIASQIGQMKKRLKGYQSPEPPESIAIEYAHNIQRIQKEVTIAVKRYILPVLEQYANKEQTIDADIPYELARAFSLVENLLLGQEAQLAKYARGIATRSFTRWNKAHRKKWIKEINKLAGVDISNIINDQLIKAALLERIDQNVNLIKTLPEEYFGKIKEIVTEGFGRGDDFFSIRDRLDQIESTHTKYRPKLIARDQMSKLTGALNKLRQEDLGITEYRWRDSGDGAVRKSHRKNNGKIFSWASRPADTGHPGEDIQCRCTAEPVLDGLLGRLQQQATWEPDDPSVRQRHPAFTKAGRLRRGYSRATGENLSRG